MGRANGVLSSMRLATSLLDIMYDIGNNVVLQMNDYTVLFKWTQTIASGDYIGNKAGKCTKIKLFKNSFSM